MEKQNRTVYVDSRVNYELDWYDEYLDWCNSCEIEPADENSREFYEWVDDRAREDYESCRDALLHCPYSNTTFAITGTLGLWDGKHSIETITIDGLHVAFETCIGRSIQDVQLAHTEGEDFFSMLCWHHDGCNEFRLYPLSADGCEAYEEAVVKSFEDDKPMPEIKKDWLIPIEDFELDFF